MLTDNHIKITLLILQNQLNIPIVYDKTADKYFIIQKQDNNLLYYDLNSETNEVYFDINNDNLIFPPSNIPILTETNRIKQGLNVSATEFKQASNGKTNVVPTEKNETATEKQQNIIETHTDKLTTKKRQRIAEFYRITDFSNMYKGYLKQVSKEIFLLTTEILQTKTQSVIDETLKLYETARTHAKKSQPTDINNLRKIKKELTTIRNRQKGIKKSIKTFNEKQQKRIKIKITIAIFLTVIFTLILINKFISPTRPKQQNETILLTKTNITEQINNYEKKNNTTVYQWRRSQIINSLENDKMTNKDFIDTLNYLIVEAWKK